MAFPPCCTGRAEREVRETLILIISKKQSIGFDFPKEANAKELLSVPYDS